MLCTESSVLQSLKSLEEIRHTDDDRTQLTRRGKNVLGRKQSSKPDLKGEEKYLRVTKNQGTLLLDKVAGKSWICPRVEIGKMLEINFLYKEWWDTGEGYPGKLWVSHPQRCLSPFWIRPWAAESVGWLPSPQRRAETGWLLGFISTQAIVYFHDFSPKGYHSNTLTV